MTGLVGHGEIDGSGVILHADAGLEALLGVPAAALAGRPLLEFALPDDRTAAAAALTRAAMSGEATSVVIGLVRDDGAYRRVHQALTPIPGSRPARYALVLHETEPPDGWADPAEMLRLARLLLDSRREGRRTFGELLFAGPAWDVLLTAYVSEAEGRTLPTAEVAALVEGAADQVERWVRALESEGLVEQEDGALRLPPEALRRLEGFLSRFARRVAATRDGADERRNIF